MSVKNIRFDYFRVVCNEYNAENNTLSQEQRPFDLSPILVKAATMNPVDTTYDLLGENARIQHIERMIWRNPQTGAEKIFWKLQLLRIRLNVLPGIATESGKFSPLELEDDEYVGEDVALLYDPEYYVIMIQRNRNSLTPTGIEQYFNRISNDYRHQIAFVSIPLPEFMRTIGENDIIRKVVLTLSTTNLDTEILPQGSALSRIINSARQCGAVTMTVNISMGRSRNGRGLNRDEVLGLANADLDENAISKYEIYRKVNQDAKVEVVDLMCGQLCDEDQFQYSRDYPITYDRIIETMFSKYIDRLPLIEELLAT